MWSLISLVRLPSTAPFPTRHSQLHETVAALTKENVELKAALAGAQTTVRCTGGSQCCAMGWLRA